MNSGSTLSSGSTGADVKRLQRILVMIKLLDYTGIDGAYGPHTQTAVEAFQQSQGLTVDGITGPLTWQALPADPDTPELSFGSTGPEVSAMQQVLQNAGLYAGPYRRRLRSQHAGCGAIVSNAARDNGGRHRRRSNLVGSGGRRRRDVGFARRFDHRLELRVAAYG